MRIQFAFLLYFSLSTSLFAQEQPAYFLSHPCLSPDGKMVVFCYEGDLWKTSVNGGTAERITAMQGNETNPRISPDGKWIAFTGRQYGNGDVFMVPLLGGLVKQMTTHSGNDELTSWSWDSKSFYFNSNRSGQIAGYQLGLEGGTPRRVFGDYFFQYDHHLIAHPTTGEIFFNDTWESNNQVHRKRYQGAFNPDIQSYDFKTGKHKRYTTWLGKDFGATIDRNGQIYFISDEKNGEYNLYTLANDKKKALTVFPTSIKSAQVSANGKSVVFEKDYQLWIYEVESGKSHQLEVTILRNSILSKDKDFDIKGKITTFDVSPDDKKFAFVSRGELFVSDVEGKFVQQIYRNSHERVAEVKWLSDNKSLLFGQTSDGYTNWFTIRADSVQAPKAITFDQKSNRNLVLNKKRTQAVFLSGRDEVKLMDLKTMTVKTLVKDELWGFRNSNPGFSPNDEYVYYTAIRNFEDDVFLYKLATGETTNLTNTAVVETDPLWSQDGKHLFFTSNRLKPAYPFGLSNAKVYRVALEKLDEPFRAIKYTELFKEMKKDTTKKTDSVDIIKPIPLDLDGFMQRLEQISPNFGTQTLEHIYRKGEKTSVLYTSNHGEGKNALWKTVLEPFEQPKTEKIGGTENSDGLQICEANDKLYALLNGNIHKLNIEGNKTEPINMTYTFRRNLAGEFRQMFYETWAKMEENFYDEQFHGVDWKQMKARYEKFLPYLNNRADLRILLNDLLGELNSSHQGFGTFGDDETITLQNQTMETGILFEEGKPYTVKSILKRSAADKSSVDVKPGDQLIKVNETVVDPKIDRNAYFTLPSRDAELKLTFERNGQPISAWIHPQPSLYPDQYDAWIDRNQQRVDSLSNRKIAYGCMKNMGQGELEQFLIDMTQELNQRQALILDLRYNTGGNVHDEVLKYLMQRTYLNWQARGGKLSPQSNFAPSDKPIVLLINEQSLSDAEMTAQGFKALKLGTIVGNETYRWIIFTSGIGLVDGSTVRMPGWGCYTLDGKDLERNGVQPDVRVVNTFEDKLKGRDPQLDKAIELLLKKLN